jgi:hypothetical protein
MVVVQANHGEAHRRLGIFGGGIEDAEAGERAECYGGGNFIHIFNWAHWRGGKAQQIRILPARQSLKAPSTRARVYDPQQRPKFETLRNYFTPLWPATLLRLTEPRSN